ncbi:hypothetical protein Tco_1428815 [Tanacetum coccineum]
MLYSAAYHSLGVLHIPLPYRNMVRPTRQNPTPEASPEPNPDIPIIIAQQLQNIIPQIVTQVTANVNNRNEGNGNGGNDGCSYKTISLIFDMVETHKSPSDEVVKLIVMIVNDFKACLWRSSV